ncbi:MAG: LysR family transcriptional regulator [Magnetococcales bacterium]|nr:LysR family transcriptional regulator [Magnetococcales bacterium]
MDLDLLRTFMEVYRTRHFGKASKNLFVTQSAVSARIRQLEELVGVSLFTRARNDIQLTSAGRRLVKTAEGMLHLWDEAKGSLHFSREGQRLLVVGALTSLWDIFLQNRVLPLARNMPGLALRCEHHSSEGLVQGLLARTLDVGFLFDPPQAPELITREITPVELILVSTRPGLEVRQALEGPYILVDWGISFSMAHARWFPDLQPPAIRVDRGRMALDFLAGFEGSAYLADIMVSDRLARGELFPVADAPTFKRQACAVYSPKRDLRPLVEEALGHMMAEGGGAEKSD